jgi:hypothetical protein
MPQRKSPDPVSHAGSGPAELSYGVVPLAEIDNPVLQQGMAYWRGLCGERKFPSRAEVTPRGILGLLRYTKLVRVIDGGRDYECRTAGDAYVMAHGYSFQGKYLSEIKPLVPTYANTVKAVYDRVVKTAAPVAIRGWVARGNHRGEHIYTEGVYLPLGPDGQTVDHVLVFAVFVPRERFDKAP